MLKQLDLASIAEEIVSPYRPIPLASLGNLEASLFICQGSKAWRRQLPHDSMLLVTEGVITVDGPTGKTVVDEGDVISVPRDVGHSTYSGMRSTVMLIEARRGGARSNGHHGPPAESFGAPQKSSVPAEAKRVAPFEWVPCGSAGRYSAYASRLLGASEPYVAQDSSLQALVHRGMLDYEAGEVRGSLVGSQLLVLPQGMPITFESKHGATVVIFLPTGLALPKPAPVAGRDPDTDPGASPGAGRAADT